MSLQQDLMGLFVILGMVVFLGTPSHCQNCEVNFHMESTSVMLLAGDNASVLCDATCFGYDAGVDVSWRNAFGKRVSSSSGRVFSVSYNRGLMNRILLINASQETVGTYLCTVTRDGQLLHHKPMEFIILGSNGNQITVPREDTGPRRGDITADRDLDYRPVRSVDRALSRVDSGLPSSDRIIRPNNSQHNQLHGKKRTQTRGDKSKYIDKNNQDIQRMGAKPEYIHGNILGIQKRGDKPKYIDKNNQLIKIHQRKELLQNNLNEVQEEKNPGEDTVKLMKTENRNNGLLGILDTGLRKSDDLISAKRVTGMNSSLSTSNIREGGQSLIGNLRARRQVGGQTTTEVPGDTTGAADTTINEAVQTNTTSEQPQTETDYMTSGESSFTTPDFEQTSEDHKVLPTQAPEKSTGKVPLEKSTGKVPVEKPTEKAEGTTDAMYDEDTSPPCTGTTTNFGKYGVLAFSITLAVALLLLYAILMIIFMPKIMAKRKERSHIEAGAYRKTGPDTSETAPLAVLDSSDTGDCDVSKQDTTGFENPAFQNEETADIKKEEMTIQTEASVSTFLLRQDSERNTNEKDQQNKPKDETKTSDKEDNTPPQPDTTTTVVSPEEQNHIDQPPTSPIDEVPPAPSEAQQSSNLLNDFRFSDFMMSASIGQSEGSSPAEGRSDSPIHLKEAVSGNGTATPGDARVDLLPPPPADENNV